MTVAALVEALGGTAADVCAPMAFSPHLRLEREWRDYATVKVAMASAISLPRAAALVDLMVVPA